MAQISKSAASLRISGHHLVPHEVTALLGCKPTSSQHKGEEIVGRVTGNVHTAHTGIWRLVAAERSPEDLNAQTSEILSKLTQDFDVWRKLSERFKIDLFVGLFMNSGNEGSEISADTIQNLGDRRIEIGLDIYDGRDDD